MAWSVFYLIGRNGKFQNYIGSGSEMNLNLHNEIGLPRDMTFEVGIDQSSTSTGIYVTDKATSFHFIGHFARAGQDKNRFFDELKYFIMRMITGAKVDLFVTEKLLPKYSHSTPVLAQLKGLINQWQIEMPELELLNKDRFVDIAPGTWKKHMYNKSKGKGRFNNKREIALDIVDKFPELRAYFDVVPRSSDYDGFDACGILHGYRAEHATDGPIQAIGGTKEFTGSIMVYYRLVNLNDIETQDDLVKGFEALYEAYGIKQMIVDPDRGWYSNVRLSMSKYDFVITTVDNPHTDTMLRWLCDFPLDSRKIVAYIVRTNKMVQAQIDNLKQLYFGEEVTW